MVPVSAPKVKKAKIAATVAAAPTPSSTPAIVYKHLSPIDQILKRPGRDVGSVVTMPATVWVAEEVPFDPRIAAVPAEPSPDEAAAAEESESEEEVVVPVSPMIAKKSASKGGSNVRMSIHPAEIRNNAAALHMIGEVLDNAKDNAFRSFGTEFPLKTIKVDVNTETNQVVIWNDGLWIPVRIHEWSPEEERLPGDNYEASIIFGHLNSSSTYDDDSTDADARKGMGLNGIGVKLTNIFSDRFEVECVDPESQQKFYQLWTGNMKSTTPPKVSSSKHPNGYTKVTFTPDLTRFQGFGGFSQDHLKAIRKLCLDASMSARCKVVFNGEPLRTKTFKDYIEYYYPKFMGLKSIKFESADTEVWIVQKPVEHRQTLDPPISFVNGACTTRGGVHVDKWLDAVFKPLVELVREKFKCKYAQKSLYTFFSVFINCNLLNPEFDGNQKKFLLAPPPATTVAAADLRKMMKWEFVGDIEDAIHALNMNELSKLDGKKEISSMPEKLTDAHEAGGPLSHECVLIVTEGDSAKALAVNGRAFLENGADFYGAMSIFGKILNVRNVKDHRKILKNERIVDLISAIGLRYKVDYSIDANYKTLRYGTVWLMMDADHDGSHIKGLVLNLFAVFYPTLLQRGYIKSFKTYIVRAIQNGKAQYFYYLRDFKAWADTQRQQGKKFEHKFYKGLGSIEEHEVPDIFTAPIVVDYVCDSQAFETTDKVFNDKRANARKQWLLDYRPSTTVYERSGQVEKLDITKFINEEMIEFSMADNARSIPRMVDGLKRSERKAVWCALKTLKKEIKVSQYGGRVSELSDYEHGENALYDMITSMSQCFVGTNNVPWFESLGSFGNRFIGPSGAASPRYIFIRSLSLIRYILRKEDDCLLDYIESDDATIEPLFYVPIIPMILVNGAKGIGTGWSTTVPQHNPLDLVAWIRSWLSDKDEAVTQTLVPWNRGFAGTVSQVGSKVTYTGKFEPMANAAGKQIGCKITELPVGVWTSEYNTWLGKTFLEKKWIRTLKDVKLGATTNTVDIQVTSQYSFTDKQLGLVSGTATSNMMAYDNQNTIRKYATQQDVMDAFCAVRFEYYQRRIKRYVIELRSQLPELASKIKFIEAVLEDIELLKQTEQSLFEFFKTDPGYYYKTDEKECQRPEQVQQEEIDGELIEKVMLEDEPDGEGTTETETSAKGYKYLTNMTVRMMTSDNLAKLIKKRDSLVAEIAQFETMDASTLWIKELDEFVEQYTKWLGHIAAEEKKTDNDRRRANAKNSKNRTEKAVVKKRKAVV